MSGTSGRGCRPRRRSSPARSARGEIRADADLELAFDLLFGPLAYRWLRGSAPDEDTINRLTSLALEGLEPEGLEPEGSDVLGGELGAEAQEDGAGGAV